MRLNDGIHVVETDECQCLGISPLFHANNGYSYETDTQYMLWKTKGGVYFTTMEYTEYIACVFFRNRKPKTGHTLHVYESKEKALKAARNYEISVMQTELKQLA